MFSCTESEGSFDGGGDGMQAPEAGLLDCAFDDMMSEFDILHAEVVNKEITELTRQERGRDRRHGPERLYHLREQQGTGLLPGLLADAGSLLTNATPNAGATRRGIFLQTKMCRNIVGGFECPRGDACRFAHEEEELRAPRGAKLQLAQGEASPPPSPASVLAVSSSVLAAFPHNSPRSHSSSLPPNIPSFGIVAGEPDCWDLPGEALWPVPATLAPVSRSGDRGEGGGGFNTDREARETGKLTYADAEARANTDANADAGRNARASRNEAEEELGVSLDVPLSRESSSEFDNLYAEVMSLASHGSSGSSR
jgi:hypothetical protein